MLTGLRVRDIALDEVKAGLSDGFIVLVDVREPQEFSAGAIPGSVSMPLSRFDARLLPIGRRVVFSCAAGVRSVRAIELAQAAGLDHGEHFGAGFKGWLGSGEPVVAGTETLA